MSGIEAVGDAVTGGLLARAVEPLTGESDGFTHEKACLNCGAKLVGPYCSACGQKSHVPRSIRAFFADFVQGLFNFEGKIWRTLPMLAWRPGELTRRYVAGERAKFISPVALYLFTVFLTFAVLNLSGALEGTAPKNVKSKLGAAVAEQQDTIAKLERQRTRALTGRQPLDAIDRKLAAEREELAQIESLRNGNFKVSTDAGDETPQWVRSVVEKAQSNPELVATHIQDSASKFSWLLIPLSVPFMWLLFPFSRRYHLYDHAVFVTYSLSFMMMLVIAGGVLVAVGATAIASLLFFVPPFHMYRQLKGAYQVGRFSAILRTIALVAFAFIAASLFLAAAVAIGAMD